MQYILIAVFSYWFACLSTVPNKMAKFLYWFGIKKKVEIKGKPYHTTIRVRPFDCEKCLAFWLCIWFYLSPNSFPIMIIYAGCISALAQVLALSTNKFLR